MAHVNMPDPQHLMLSALKAEIDRLFDAGEFDAEDMQWIYENEPESVVFTGEDLEHDYVDMEEAMETVMAVGERDLDAKIRYWQDVLRRKQHEDAPHCPEGDPEFRPGL